MTDHNCIVVLGPTASGKTALACRIAHELNVEIISADSRQVYKKLDIGTGKDLNEYSINGTRIPYHLIDVCDPSDQFYLHDFIHLCDQAFHDITSRGRLPVICGGTGLYLDALVKDFSLTRIPENETLRSELANLNKEQLVQRLRIYPSEFTSHADESSVKRIIRAIEVAEYRVKHPVEFKPAERPYKPYYIGLDSDPVTRKSRIFERLDIRLDQGMIEEVKSLLDAGVSHERLQKFGLEYKFVSEFLLGQMDRQTLRARLGTAILQYAKRQMTWFRKMEREGTRIHWVKREETEALMNALKGQFIPK